VKAEFFIAFQKAYNKTMIKKNIKTEFFEASLFSHNLQAVLSKLDVKLHTSTFTEPLPTDS
jgi:hypothetical protein